MSESRHVPILVAVLALLLVPAAFAQAQPQPAFSGACAAIQNRCSANCFGLADAQAVVPCLIGCDNAAATCTRGEDRVTLSSEEYLAQRGGNSLVTRAAACNPTTPCPPEYGSCASWSAYYDCGDPFCGVYGHCGDPCGEPLCFGDATRQFRERYRVCFNQQAQPCTEYQRTSVVLGCGC